MFYKKQIGVVVNGYGTGAEYVPYLRGWGIDCVHIQSSSEMPQRLIAMYKPDTYVLNLVWQDDLSALRKALEPYELRFIVPGSELGVELADYLNHVFGMATANVYAKSKARRNKYYMHECLKAAGVRSNRHAKSSSCDDLLDWVRGDGARYPYVVKPLASASSDSVRICYDEADVRTAFDRIIGARTIYNELNEEVLIEHYLDAGEVEYCVNTVSCQGRHFVSEIIRVHRRRIDNIPVHDYNELLCPVGDRAVYDELSEYVVAVLDALGIEHGAGHSEVMVTADGPVLLETGARMPGRIDLSAYAKALGYNQLTVLFESLLYPDLFFRRLAEKRQPLRLHSSCVFMISDVAGDIRSPLEVCELERLGPALHSFLLKNDGQLQITDDFTNSPGQAFFLSADRSELARRRAAFREFERELYVRMIRPPVRPAA